MKYFTITVILCLGACLGNANDDPDINGGQVTDASITEINPPSPNTGTTTINPKSSTTTETTTTPVTTSTTSPSTSKPGPPTPKPEPPTPKPEPPTPKPEPPNPKPNPTSQPTTSTVTPNSTMAPVTTTALPHHDRKFDGPSFFGGIILALGLVAIGFVAFKFYMARAEHNYHTL